MAKIRPGFEREHHFAGSHEEAKAEARRRMHAMTPAERLQTASEMIRRAYGIPLNQKMKVDRTVFSMRTHPD